jgi:hypothetical protein
MNYSGRKRKKGKPQFDMRLTNPPEFPFAKRY